VNNTPAAGATRPASNRNMKIMTRALQSVALAAFVGLIAQANAAQPMVSPRGSANPVKVTTGVGDTDLVGGKVLPKSSPRLQATPHPVAANPVKKDRDLVKEAPVYTGRVPNAKPTSSRPEPMPQFETAPAPVPAATPAPGPAKR
jgi:hypothetical protein